MEELKRKAFEAKQWLLPQARLKHSRELIDRDRWTAEELAELNWKRRKAIVHHAYFNSAFYRKKYDEAGFHPERLLHPGDFTLVPILGKEEVRQNATTITTRGYASRRLMASTTGGSTGEPLKVYLDPGRSPVPLSWRMLRWWGIHPSDNSGYLYRSVPSGWQRRGQEMLLWPTRRAWISALEMTQAHLYRFYKTLARIKPKYLVGYVGAVDVFAAFLVRHSLRIDSLKAVWTTAAPLPEVVRRGLGDVYQAPVYTQYGSCEFFFLAAECPAQSGLHVAADERHVESTADGLGDGTGEILVTDLTNWAFPLIRYRIGDRGRMLQRRCSCGLPYPLMDYVRGRVSENVLLPDGNAVPGEFWTTVFDDHVELVKAFQVHQYLDYSVELRYEPRTDRDTSLVERQIEAKLHRLVRERIQVRFVKGPVTSNDEGKSRYVTSDFSEHQRAGQR